MGVESIRVPGQTTLQGRFQSADGITFASIQAQNDAVMTINSKNGAGDPTEIQWVSDRISPHWKAVQTLTYDGDGDLESTTNTIEER